jgi:hypothetical protein
MSHIMMPVSVSVQHDVLILFWYIETAIPLQAMFMLITGHVLR